MPRLRSEVLRLEVQLAEALQALAAEDLLEGGGAGTGGGSFGGAAAAAAAPIGAPAEAPAVLEAMRPRRPAPELGEQRNSREIRLLAPR